MSAFNGNVTIVGGTIDDTAIGNTTVSTAKFSTLDADGATTLDQVTVVTDDGAMSVSGTNGVDIDVAAASRFVTSAGDITIDSESGTLIMDGATAVTVDSTGGVSIDGGAASNFTASGGDLTLSGSGTSVNILSNEAVADALRLNASNAAGGIDVDAGTGGIAVDTTGAISLDASAASNFSTSIGDLTISAPAGSAIVTSGEAAADAVKLNASNAAGGIDVDAGTGGITVDTTGALSLDAAAASNLSTSAGSLTLSAAVHVTTPSLTRVTNATTSTTPATGALVVTGGVGIGENLNVTGNAIVDGDLTVNGVTTTVNTTTLTVEDPLMELARLNTTSDVVDIGIYGQYNEGPGVRYAGLVRDATDNCWKLFDSEPTAPASNVFGAFGTFADLCAGKLTLSDTTNATSKDTGSIVTDGGVGIELDLWVGGCVYTDCIRAEADTTLVIGDLVDDVCISSVGNKTTIKGDFCVDGATTVAGTLELSTERISVAGGGVASFTGTKDICLITVTSSGTATGSMADGTSDGQRKYIIASSIASGGKYEISGKFTDAAGTANQSLRFQKTGQSLTVIWDNIVGQWFFANAGVTVF